jgi:hypothetical protein
MGVTTGKSAFQPNIVTNGLVLNLDAINPNSYPQSGTIWYDTSGNNNSGTLTNGTSWTPNGAQTSFSFDGVDDYVGIAGIQTPSFTINSWVKLNELNRFHGIMGRADSIWGNTSYAFRVVNTNQLNIVLSHNGDGGGLVETQTITTLLSNTWYQVTATFIKPNVVLYINGISSITNTFNYDLFNSTSNSIIGGYTYGNGLSYLMKGNISNIQFYNRALTAQEVLQNYNALKSRFGLT